MTASLASDDTRRLDPESSPRSLYVSTQTQNDGNHSRPESFQLTRSKRRRFNLKLNPKTIYDAILGLSDGLTVPFALTAGLASVTSTKIVILGGFAELMAGAISMGLGGFVGSKSEVDAYRSAVRKCDILIQDSPDDARGVVENHFRQYSAREKDVEILTNGVIASPDSLRELLLKHHFEVDQPDALRPYVSALTLCLSYFLGGFLALIPYLCVKPDQILTALWISIGIMAFVMFVFGYVKTAIIRGWRGRANVLAGLKGAVQMLVIGAVAVGAAVGLVRAIEGTHVAKS